MEFMSLKSGDIDGVRQQCLNYWAHLVDEVINSNFLLPLDTGMNGMKHK